MDIEEALNELSWLIEEAKTLAEDIENECPNIDVYEIAKQRMVKSPYNQVLH